MAEARHAPGIAAKNEAMRALFHSAGWQWAAWMLAGFGLLHLARRSIPPAIGVAVTLAVWATAAWLGRVPWPLTADRAFEPGREGAWWFTMPAPFVWWLCASAVVVLVASGSLRKWLPAGPQTIASRVGYPGFVFMTGIGFLLLLDLSANGHLGNRYLALYHQGHLWLGMLIFSVLVFLRQPLGRMLGWWLSVLDGAASVVARRVGARWATSVFVLMILLLIGSVGFLLTNIRQLTSELGSRVADRRRRLVLLSPRRAARRTHSAQRQLGAVARPLRVAAAVRGAGPDRSDAGDPRHGTAADRRVWRGRVRGRLHRDVVASASWRDAHGVCHRGRHVRAVDPGHDVFAVRAGLDRRRHRGPPRESRGAAGFRE
jgi:hypothetical protein